MPDRAAGGFDAGRATRAEMQIDAVALKHWRRRLCTEENAAAVIEGLDAAYREASESGRRAA